MKDDFQHRWQTAARAARRAPDAPAEMPPGFMTRLLARHQAAPVGPWADLITAFGLRAVAASALVFAAGAALVLWQMDMVPLVPEGFEVPFTPEVLLP